MASYLLDTGVLIRCLRGYTETVRLLDDLRASGELHISAVTYLEIIAGMQPREEDITYDILSGCTSHPLDDAIAEQAGRLIARYRTQGMALGVPDAAIAATAILYGLTLVTYNTRDFPMRELRLYPLPQA